MDEMKIYDCFTYFEEMELLELRLHTVYPVVDKIVMVEANRTFTNKGKDFVFEKNREKFGEFLDKIIYIKVDDMPMSDNPWELEAFQRNCIMRGLTDAAENDLVLISDLDEIPNPEVVKMFRDVNPVKNEVERNPIAFAQKLYYYYLNCVDQSYWHGTVAAKYRDVKQRGSIEKGIRQNREYFPRLRDGGWHFTYMGGVEKIIRKIQSVSEMEKDTPQNNDPEFVRNQIDNGLMEIHRSREDAMKSSGRFVQIDETYPHYAKTLISKYPVFFREQEKYASADEAYPIESSALIYNRWQWKKRCAKLMIKRLLNLKDKALML